MEVYLPDMNPLRFYRYNELPDWVTYFPNMKNYYPDSKNIEGIYPTKFFQDWIIGKTMSLQFPLTLIGNEDLTIYKYNPITNSYAADDTISPVNITPTGWISPVVRRYNYTFSEAGTYYIDSSSAGVRSLKFVVHSELYLKRRLVQIQFANSVNDYGMIFYDGLTPRYTGLAYFTSQPLPDSPGNEMSVFKTVRGQLIKQRSTPQNMQKLILTVIHHSLIPMINDIFSCDNITVNGLTFQNAAAGDWERIKKSDVGNITVELTETNYTYQR